MFQETFLKNKSSKMLKIKHCNFQGPGPGIRLEPWPGPGPGPESVPGPDIQTYKNRKKSCQLKTLIHSNQKKILKKIRI